MEISDRIRSLRVEKGLKQKDLAKMAGVAPNTLSRIEQGKFNPSLKTLSKLADALGINLSDFYSGVSLICEQELRAILEKHGSESFIKAAEKIIKELKDK